MKELPRSLTPAARFLARHSAIIGLAVFAIAGAAVFDDYGVSYDEPEQRGNGQAALDYVLGNENALLYNDPALYGGGRFHSDAKFFGVARLYGAAFEFPLTIVERVLGLSDPRDIHLSRHLLAHLFFLAAGFCASLLAYRLFGSRLIALLSMLLFLTHPRLYAHSFFNPKDLPFLSMFMIALYLTHRAFRRDTVWAFALCGAGAALLANMRVMGFILFPAVLGMLALDAFYAMKRGGRGDKRIYANMCAFSTAFAATLYAAWPLLWRDPLNLAEAFGALAQYPVHVATLFRGEVVQWPNMPWDYIPIWILTTTPPAALLLAAIGIFYPARRRAVRRRDMFTNSTARFGLLALACLTAPIIAAVALNSNLYNGWRHMYFLYAPLCVLAAFGLRALADIPRPNLRAAALALAALGIALAGVQTVRLHPYQNEYFSPIVDKGALADRWEMGYWLVSRKEALETILAMQPNGRIAVIDYIKGGVNNAGLERNASIIPADERRRLHINPNFPSYIIASGDQSIRDGGGYDGRPVVWTREIYGVPLVSVLDARAYSAAAHSAAYAAARASAPDASGGGFDMRADGGKLTYIKENCGEDDTLGTFALSVFPAERDYDLANPARNDGWKRRSLDFDFHNYGAMLDGKCVIVRDLPDIPISHVETGRRLPGGGESWSARIPFDGYYERYRRALAALAGEPAIRSDFDVYPKDGALTYVKEGCAETDARGRFFLSVFPADPNDLPQDARDAGFEHEPLNFDFERDGAIFDGKCAIIRDLPDYRISHVETGQWTESAGVLWSGEILFEAYYERYRAALATLSGEPAIRSDFDVYLKDGALTYVKEGCAEDDARGRFFLSVFPADPNDLPQDARDAGFEHEPLNFDFSERGAGAVFDGKCAIIRDLPDYPISRIETGQFIPGEGELWSAGAAVGD